MYGEDGVIVQAIIVWGGLFHLTRTFFNTAPAIIFFSFQKDIMGAASMKVSWPEKEDVSVTFYYVAKIRRGGVKRFISGP